MFILKNKSMRNVVLFSFFNAFALERAIFFIFFTRSGHRPAEIAILQTTFFLSVFLFEIPTGFFADMFGKKISLIIGTLLKALSLVIQVHVVERFPSLFLAFILYALSFAFISGSLSAIMFEKLKEDSETERYMKCAAFVELIDSLSLAVAMIFGPLVKEYFDWNGVYYLTAVANVFAAFFIYFVPNKVGVTSQKVDIDRISSLRNFFQTAKSIFWKVLPLSLVHACMTPIFINSQLLYSELGENLSAIGMGIGITEIVSALYVYLFAKSRRDFDQPLFLQLATLFTALVAVNFVGSFYLSLLSLALIGIIAVYLTISFQNYTQHQINDDGIRASVLSFISFLDTIFIAGGSMAFGIFTEHFSVKVSIGLLGLFPLAGVLITLFQMKGNEDVVEA